jgi:GTP-binding protein
MLAWRAETDLPAQVVLTKADKLSRGAAIATLKQVEKALAGQNCQVQLFSVPQKQGIEQLQQRLDEWLQDEPADEPAAAEPAA